MNLEMHLPKGVCTDASFLLRSDEGNECTSPPPPKRQATARASHMVRYKQLLPLDPLSRPWPLQLPAVICILVHAVLFDTPIS